MTAICCPAKSPCPDHKMLKADLIAELQRTRAELTKAQIMLERVRLAAIHPHPMSFPARPYDTIAQLASRLGKIGKSTDWFLHTPGDDEFCARLLGKWVDQEPFTYEVNRITAAHEADLAEATQ